jgi:hypothetical protein
MAANAVTSPRTRGGSGSALLPAQVAATAASVVTASARWCSCTAAVFSNALRHPAISQYLQQQLARIRPQPPAPQQVRTQPLLRPANKVARAWAAAALRSTSP